jgi:hypothetical protein
VKVVVDFSEPMTGLGAPQAVIRRKAASLNNPLPIINRRSG